MKVIGLTGGAGSGKSTVADIIVKNFKVYAIYTDEIARRQMQKGGASYDGVVKEFGEDILLENKEIDRKKLAMIVFADEKKLLRLNELTHPQVLIEVHATIERLREEGNYQAVLVETALLKEAGYVSFCDEIWYVYASEEERRERLKTTRGYSDAKIDDLFSKQKKDAEFREYCTNIIYNEKGNTKENIIKQISKLL
ncbi:dephospho-CoA kinase [Clostridium sp. Marseille-P299]|uniref:dephospho-CoA kinase n=1 Tax=Clostridium sp. Marseille-P299 TaxID=1805477 RepID=UPI00083652E2|nr:dephospho-CoA kinase [Clostridium sp. Marseille-P299]